VAKDTSLNCRYEDLGGVYSWQSHKSLHDRLANGRATTIKPMAMTFRAQLKISAESTSPHANHADTMTFLGIFNMRKTAGVISLK